MATKKDEAVTASFHFLQRTREGANGDRIPVKFTEQAFASLVHRIETLPPLDLSDPNVADLVRIRQMAPLGPISRIDSRTVFGRFEAGYWGHSYNNTEKGEISADSISLRPFFYIMYLSDSGVIYLGTQYIGLFGGYGALKSTIRDFLGYPASIQSHAIRLGAAAYKNARPIAINIEVSNRGKSPAHSGSIGTKAAVIFKKSTKDDGFEGVVSERVFPALDKGKIAVKHAIAGLMNESDLMTVDESDIEDATIIAVVGKKKKVIHLIESGSVATRFHLDVNRELNGHPVEGETKAAMLSTLKDEILSRKI